MEYDKNLFGEIERFISLKICGKECQVPDRLEMLRVFQFLGFEIDYARLCWNASCQRCFVEYQKNGKSVRALACRTRSSESIEITKLPPTIREKP